VAGLLVQHRANALTSEVPLTHYVHCLLGDSLFNLITIQIADAWIDVREHWLDVIPEQESCSGD